MSGQVRFSPLHEGDTSVAHPFQAIPQPVLVFQSPSRGGHLRGFADTTNLDTVYSVSVPFTRGTPPWRSAPRRSPPARRRFSPLHEGDTSVAPTNQ